MKLLTVDTIEEARKKLLNCTANWELQTERLELKKAHGRILAEDIYAKEDIPSFRRSTVDGYALISADTAGAGEAQPVFLKLAGSVEMGKSANLTLKSGECAYVPTGGMLPEGCDAVVMIEYCEIFDKEIAVYESAAVGSHVVRIGEDAQQGSLLLRRGTKLLAPETGALAAAGITEVPVYIPLRLFIISSGDELIEPYAQPSPGEIRDINTFALGAIAEESGYQIAGSQLLKDNERELETAVQSAMQKSNVVVISGGSSQGEKDMTEKVLSRVSNDGVFTHGLAVKPGKPTILGYDKESKTVLAGLPGHPVSALIVFRVLLSWLVRQLTSQKEPYPVPAKLACNLAGSPGRTVYQPVTLEPCGEGYRAQPVFGKAGMITTLTNADGYIVIDMNKEGLAEGETVQVYLWRSPYARYLNSTTNDTNIHE